METPLFRLADVGSADPCRLLYDLFDMFLRPLLYGVELANNPLQSIATYLLALAQLLGIAIRCGIDGMVLSYVACTSYASGYHPYYSHVGFCHCAIETIEYPATIATKNQVKCYELAIRE